MTAFTGLICYIAEEPENECLQPGLKMLDLQWILRKFANEIQNKQLIRQQANIWLQEWFELGASNISLVQNLGFQQYLYFKNHDAKILGWKFEDN